MQYMKNNDCNKANCQDVGNNSNEDSDGNKQIILW